MVDASESSIRWDVGDSIFRGMAGWQLYHNEIKNDQGWENPDKKQIIQEA